MSEQGSSRRSFMATAAVLSAAALPLGAGIIAEASQAPAVPLEPVGPQWPPRPEGYITLRNGKHAVRVNRDALSSESGTGQYIVTKENGDSRQFTDVIFAGQVRFERTVSEERVGCGYGTVASVSLVTDDPLYVKK